MLDAHIIDVKTELWANRLPLNKVTKVKGPRGTSSWILMLVLGPHLYCYL